MATQTAATQQCSRRAGRDGFARFLPGPQRVLLLTRNSGRLAAQWLDDAARRLRSLRRDVLPPPRAGFAAHRERQSAATSFLPIQTMCSRRDSGVDQKILASRRTPPDLLTRQLARRWPIRRAAETSSVRPAPSSAAFVDRIPARTRRYRPAVRCAQAAALRARRRPRSPHGRRTG